MRVPATPYHESFAIDDDGRDDSRTGIYAAAIPIAGIVCFGLWALAIWKVVDLIAGT
jgi:hypothetical protein